MSSRYYAEILRILKLLGEIEKDLPILRLSDEYKDSISSAILKIKDGINKAEEGFEDLKNAIKAENFEI